MIVLDNGTVITPVDLSFTTSRSPGPGGQNVNKVETRVTVWFDLTGSGAFDEEQKARIRGRLGGRIDRRGRLRVSSHRHRTQGANRAAVVERLAELLAGALETDPPRRPTRPSKGARRRRLGDKRRVAEAKRLRRPPSLDD